MRHPVLVQSHSLRRKVELRVAALTEWIDIPWSALALAAAIQAAGDVRAFVQPLEWRGSAWAVMSGLAQALPVFGAFDADAARHGQAFAGLRNGQKLEPFSTP